MDIAPPAHARRVLNPSREYESRPRGLLRRDIALGSIEIGTGKEFIHLVLQVFAVLGVRHA